MVRMCNVLIALALALSQSVAVASDVPAYDPAAWCAAVFENHDFLDVCLAGEDRTAAALAAGPSIPPEIVAWCDTIVTGGGTKPGSFFGVHSCVQEAFTVMWQERR